MTGAKHVIHEAARTVVVVGHSVAVPLPLEGVRLLRNGGHYAFAGMAKPSDGLMPLTVSYFDVLPAPP